MALLLTASLVVEGASGGKIHERVGDVPPQPVAIVFGAGLSPDGSPSPALARRVEAASDLYRAGRVNRLLMTGDSGSLGHDEVGPMRELAIQHGVPARDILTDPAGYRTYESCERARDVFGIQEAVVVTQAYHLPRTIYTCERLGVAAVGLVADQFTGPTFLIAAVRERFAQVYSWLELDFGNLAKIGSPFPSNAAAIAASF